MKNIHELKLALKNNCFRVYAIITEGKNVRVTHAKVIKNTLHINTVNGWVISNLSNLFTA